MVNPTSEELREKANAKGYRPGAHVETDGEKPKPRYSEKILKDQDGALQLYIKWIQGLKNEEKIQLGINIEAAEINSPYYCLREGAPLAELIVTKDFARYKIAISRALIARVTTVDSVNTFLEWFFAGFTRKTDTIVPDVYRAECYHTVRTSFKDQGLVVNAKKQKRLFNKTDLIRFLTAFWTADDTIFVHPRNKIQIPFIFGVFCHTGARCGAFFPTANNNKEGCLRYKDIELVLLRIPDGWKAIYQIKQRWVKYNQDPENIWYGISSSQHEKLIFDDTSYLLTLAFADKAIKGVDSPKEFYQLQIPKYEDILILRWNDSVKDLPILRNATLANGVTDQPLSMAAFNRIIKAVLVVCGYFVSVTIHAMRRNLGKRLDERYPETQRSQHINHVDPRVYGQSYLACTSSCDGKSAFIGEEANHDHVEVFQGHDLVRESGLPQFLPAEKEALLEQNTELCKLKEKLKKLQANAADNADVSSALNKVRSYREHLRTSSLRNHRDLWVEQQRDRKVEMQGKGEPKDVTLTEQVRALSNIFPERDRLSKTMISTTAASEPGRRQALADLFTFITRDYEVLYLPGEEPVNGACPVETCSKKMESLAKRQRSIHTHNCRLKEHSAALARLQSELHYCYECFAWIVEEDWEGHYSQHLDSINSKRCGSITYCHTVIRPAWCPFCLGSKELKTSTRDADLISHIETHLYERRWPSPCPHPLCSLELEDEVSFWYHMSDVHRFTKGKGQKRRATDDPTDNDEDSGFQAETQRKINIKEYLPSQSLYKPRSKIGCQRGIPNSTRLLPPEPTTLSNERSPAESGDRHPADTLSDCSTLAEDCSTESPVARDFVNSSILLEETFGDTKPGAFSACSVPMQLNDSDTPISDHSNVDDELGLGQEAKRDCNKYIIGELSTYSKIYNSGADAIALRKRQLINDRKRCLKNPVRAQGASQKSKPFIVLRLNQLVESRKTTAEMDTTQDIIDSSSLYNEPVNHAPYPPSPTPPCLLPPMQMPLTSQTTEVIYDRYAKERDAWLGNNQKVKKGDWRAYRKSRGFELISERLIKDVRNRMDPQRHTSTGEVVPGRAKWTDEEVHAWSDYRRATEKTI